MSATRAVLVVGDDAEVLRVGNLLREDERTALPRRDRRGLRVLEDVVAETDDELLAAREVARHADDLRDPAGLDLNLVGEIEVEEHLVAGARTQTAVAEQVDEVAGVLLRRSRAAPRARRAAAGAAAGSRPSASARRAAGACS